MPDISSNNGPIELRKVPRLVQSRIDELIERGKTGGLSDEEHELLAEALEYLDDMTLLELHRLEQSTNTASPSK